MEIDTENIEEILSVEEINEFRNRINSFVSEFDEEMKKFEKRLESFFKEWMELYEKLQEGRIDEEEYDMLDQQYSDRYIQQIWGTEFEEIVSRISEKYGFEYENYDVDSVCRVNCPAGMPNVWDEYYTIFLRDKKKRYILVEVYFNAGYERRYYQPTAWWYNGITGSRILMKAKEGGFAETLVDNIPWEYIRQTWFPSVNEMIREIIKAEWIGEEELVNTLRRIILRIKQGFWIYDYQHFYSALLDTLNEDRFKHIREKLEEALKEVGGI